MLSNKKLTLLENTPNELKFIYTEWQFNKNKYDSNMIYNSLSDPLVLVIICT